MEKKSERSDPESISATDASRSFSAILDAVEAGRTYVIERHGRRVCLLSRPPAEGRRASECLALLRERPAVLLDDRFSEDLLDVIQGEGSEARPWDS